MRSYDLPPHRRDSLEAAASSHLKGLPFILCVIALCFATLIIILDYSIANVSIPYIAGDLAVSKEEGTYVITSFAVGNAIVLAISGWLTKRIGIIRLTIVSLIGFALFSWVCGISRHLPVLVLARFLQGVVAGPLIPLSQTLLITIFPPEKKNAALAFWSSIVVIGPVVGPILGGWITYDFSWPWIFFINIPICVFAVIVIQSFMKDHETPRQRVPTDWIGLILLAIGVSTLQFLLDKGEQFDWWHSMIIRTCIITSALSFLYLLIWEFFHKRPVLELSLFKYRSYATSIVVIGTQYAIYFGSLVLVPLWLQEYMGYTPLWAGFAISPFLLAPLLLSWMMNRLISRFGSYRPLAFSNILFAIACFFALSGNTDVNFLWIAFGRFLFSFGLLFMIVPVFALALSDISKEKLPQATGMFHFVRAMSGGIGTAVFTTLWIRRSAFHHANLAADVTLDRPTVSSFFHDMSLLNVKGKEAWVMMNEFVTRQGAMLGLNDCFYLMGWIFLLLFAFLVVNYRRKSAK